MYTHLYVSHDDAEKLFIAFARKPLKPGESGAVTLATLDEHFAKYGETYLAMLDAALSHVRSADLFVLKFREYLPHLPQRLIDLEITIVQAEIVRFHSAPTRARAGYYEAPKISCCATVEAVFPAQQSEQFKKPVPLYAQNINVSGPSLALVQDFNTKLSQGQYNRFLVNAFE